MKNFCKKFKSKEFYKKNWHRFLVAPILFFGIYVSSFIYLFSGGFHIFFGLSLIFGFVFSIGFAINYNKKYFICLVIILLIQLITANLNTSKFEVDCNSYYYTSSNKNIHCTCLGLNRQYYEAKKCVGKRINCIIEEVRNEPDGKKIIDKNSFPCNDYEKITEMYYNVFLKKHLQEQAKMWNTLPPEAAIEMPIKFKKLTE